VGWRWFGGGNRLKGFRDEGVKDLSPDRVGVQKRGAREYWEGEIVATCDNYVAFPSKTISRYKSVSKKS